MNAAEEIQAAIDKLTALRDKSTPGPWFLTYESATHPRVWGAADEDAADHVATMARSPRDADLIVTLHRTISAQLAILRESMRFARADALFDDATELALARAINGGA